MIAITGDGTQISFGTDSAVRPSPVLHQLRPPPKDFTGRQTELETLLSAIHAGGACITGLHGPPGVGKTALALVLAHQVEDAYPDAQLFVDLRGTSDAPLSPVEALQRVIQSFQPEVKLPDALEELRARYLSLLHAKKALIVADNATDADQVRPLIPPPACLLLVTSRRHFKVEGLFDLRLDTLPEPDAVKLLLKICPRIAEHADPVAQLCGYLPLALRAAASLLSVRPDIAVDAYVHDLGDERTRLEQIGDEGVEISVEASLNLSYRQLPPAAARVFRLLSVFPATFDAPAEEQVCEDQGHVSLGDLLRHSLVEFDEATQRYHLHDLVRIFAAHRLDEPAHAADRLPAEQRHAEYYRTVLVAAEERYQKGGGETLEGLAMADAEWSNILAGAAWAGGHAQWSPTVLGLVSKYPEACADVLELRLQPQERTVWLEAAISAARKLVDRAAEGRHLGNLGNACADLGESRRALESYEQTLDIARTTGDRRAEGTTLGNLGIVYAVLGQPRRAIESFERALEIARAIADGAAEGRHLGNLGIVYEALGEPLRAIKLFEQSLEIARALGDRRGEGIALGNLGNAYYHLGEPRRAIEFYERHLEIARALGDRRGEGAALGNLGIAQAALPNPRRAVTYYERALVISRETGDHRGEGEDLGNLGSAYVDLGDPRRAIEFLEQSLRIGRAIGDRLAEANALGNLAVAYNDLGQPDRAIELYGQVLEIARAIGDRRAEANACWNMGLMYGEFGDLSRAAELMQVRVDYERELGHPDAEKHASEVAALRACLK